MASPAPNPPPPPPGPPDPGRPAGPPMPPRVPFPPPPGLIQTQAATQAQFPTAGPQQQQPAAPAVKPPPRAGGTQVMLHSPSIDGTSAPQPAPAPPIAPARSGATLAVAPSLPGRSGATPAVPPPAPPHAAPIPKTMFRPMVSEDALAAPTPARAPGRPASPAQSAPRGVPERFEELGQFEVDPDAAQMLKQEFCEKNKCVILGSIDPRNVAQMVPVGMLDTTNDELVREIEGVVGRRVRPVQLNEYEIRQAIKKAFGLSTSSAKIHAVTLDFARAISFEPDQAPSAMLDDMLAAAIKFGATDIHIETYAKDVDLRFRKDGVLSQVTTPFSPDNVKKIISRVKVLCDLDIAAKPQPLDARFSANYAAENGLVRTVHFRVSIVPSPAGEDCVMRVLDPSVARRTLDHLGMTPGAMQVLRSLLKCPSGLILITGPTGSGKTTTLYASLHELHSEELKICTVEDPIEYEVPKVNQKQIDEELTFAAYAKALLRQDPDVILIGEIRDADTAQVAVRAASTGHLVLSTVHTDDAIAAITRLRALGIEDELLSTTLLGTTAQRLVRRVCKHCAVNYAPKADTFVRYFQDDPGHPFLRGKGCEHCHDTGYTGVVGVYEVFVVDDAIAAGIARGATVDELREKAKERGFQPLVEQALERVRDGTTTIEEVERTIRPLYFV